MSFLPALQCMSFLPALQCMSFLPVFSSFLPVHVFSSPTMIDAAFEATIAGDNQKTTFEVRDVTGEGGVYALKLQMLAEAIMRNQTEFGKILGTLDSNPTLPTTVYLTPKIRVVDKDLTKPNADADVEIVRKKANGDLVLTIQLNPIPMPMGNPAPAFSIQGALPMPQHGPARTAAPSPAAPSTPATVPAQTRPDPQHVEPYRPRGATSSKDNGLKRSVYIPPPRPSRSTTLGKPGPLPTRPPKIIDTPLTKP
jgi:hypothetical protein